jgi:hypothetical protein
MIYLPILDILRSYFEIKDGDPELTIKKKTEEKIIDFDEKLKGVLSLMRKGKEPLRPLGTC